MVSVGMGMGMGEGEGGRVGMSARGRAVVVDAGGRQGLLLGRGRVGGVGRQGRRGRVRGVGVC